MQSAASFTQSTVILSEKDGARTIDVSLSKPATENGEIILTATTSGGSCFVTEPATENGQIRIPVQAGRNLLHFNVSPVDNKVLDGRKLIQFSITSLTKGLRKGDTRSITVSVNDDEGPVNADFTEAGMSIRESDQAGGKINIAFASAAPTDAVLVFKFTTKAKYGVDYITAPASVSDKIFVQVAKGATSASVSVLPLNDNVFKADRNINVELYDATGGLQVGDNTSFWCTINEDDGQQISTIFEVRSMLGADGITLHDTYVEGIVTSISNVSGGRIVIEDATGALPIQLKVDNKVTRGDVILVNLDNGLLHLQQGVLEVKDVVSFQKLGEESLQVNKLSLEDLLRSTDRVQSQTVQITGVSFKQADGTTRFLGDQVVSDGNNTIIVRTIPVATFSDQPVPTGLLNVTGIFVNVDGQNYLYPQDITDIRRQGLMPIRPRFDD